MKPNAVYFKVGSLFLTLLFTQMLPAQSNKILFVMSAADTLPLNQGAKLRQTGVFLNEFYMAYKAVTEAGYAVDFATPHGIVATIDEESLNDTYWKKDLKLKHEAIHFTKTNYAFNNPITLEKAIQNEANYIGMVIPGGQGLMMDLAYDDHIPTLLMHFSKGKKPTGLICHAPSLLLTIPKDENPYIGFKVNAVSPLEEFVIERFIMKGKPASRKIAKRLKEMGLKYRSGLPKADYAVKDRNLVTSQNPFSGNSFNILYLQTLSEYLESLN
jgi:putative intracellular protease/amidase